MTRRAQQINFVWFGLSIGIVLIAFWALCRPVFASDPNSIETIKSVPDVTVNQVYLEHQRGLLDGSIRTGMIDAIYEDHIVIDDHYFFYSSSTRLLDAYQGIPASKTQFRVKMVVEYKLNGSRITEMWPQQKPGTQGK